MSSMILHSLCMKVHSIIFTPTRLEWSPCLSYLTPAVSTLTCLERSFLLNGLGTLSAGSGPMEASLRQTRWYIRISSRWRSLIVFHTAVADPLPPSSGGGASCFPSPSSADLTPSVLFVSLWDWGSGLNTSSCIS